MIQLIDSLNHATIKIINDIDMQRNQDATHQTIILIEIKGKRTRHVSLRIIKYP